MLISGMIFSVVFCGLSGIAFQLRTVNQKYDMLPRCHSERFRILPDGLYQVVTKDFTAGFEVVNGGLGACSPVLRKNIIFWAKLAKRVTASSLQ